LPARTRALRALRKCRYVCRARQQIQQGHFPDHIASAEDRQKGFLTIPGGKRDFYRPFEDHVAATVRRIAFAKDDAARWNTGNARRCHEFGSGFVAHGAERIFAAQQGDYVGARVDALWFSRLPFRSAGSILGGCRHAAVSPSFVRGDHVSSVGLLPTSAQPVVEMGARAALRKLITTIAIIANGNHAAGRRCRSARY
jgi:hypothetical protein